MDRRSSTLVVARRADEGHDAPPRAATAPIAGISPWLAGERFGQDVSAANEVRTLQHGV
jgi:hypothetical protein